jgi:hypothetical protein
MALYFFFRAVAALTEYVNDATVYNGFVTLSSPDNPTFVP